MNQPTVSIIVPVYNVEPYVEDCIRSVMRQTYDGPIECIIVDDCGTDDSIAVVERLISEYNGPISFNVLHHEHNRGLSAARNTGMDAAIGDYLFFLDSDDELTKDCIEKLMAPVEGKQYDIVSSNFLHVDEKGQEILGERKYDEIVIEGTSLLPALNQQKWTISAWNKLYLSGFIRSNQLRFKEGLIFEDVLWSFQIASLATSLCVVKDTTYIYKIRPGNITSTNRKESYVPNYHVIFQEMNDFTEHNHVNSTDVFYYMNLYFLRVISHFTDSSSKYVSVYHSLRPYIKTQLTTIIHANRFHIKGIFRDLHYLMPCFFAPYWQYFVFVKIRSSIIKLVGVIKSI